ncbi:hypothetical protein BH11PSE12_BH11PSE12_18120 [soil metagenome]
MNDRPLAIQLDYLNDDIKITLRIVHECANTVKKLDAFIYATNETGKKKTTSFYSQ